MSRFEDFTAEELDALEEAVAGASSATPLRDVLAEVYREIALERQSRSRHALASRASGKEPEGTYAVEVSRGPLLGLWTGVLYHAEPGHENTPVKVGPVPGGFVQREALVAAAVRMACRHRGDEADSMVRLDLPPRA